MLGPSLRMRKKLEYPPPPPPGVPAGLRHNQLPLLHVFCHGSYRSVVQFDLWLNILETLHSQGKYVGYCFLAGFLLQHIQFENTHIAFKKTLNKTQVRGVH